MKILVRDAWEGGFLDEYCPPGARRITVCRWIVVRELDDLFVASPYDLRRLIDYGRELGPVEVARKVVSRLTERNRNDKVAACGLGVDVESGAKVAFFAPRAPRGTERVVLPAQLAWPHSHDSTPIEHTTHITDAFDGWAGWSMHSGVDLPDTGPLQALVANIVERPTKYDPIEASAVNEFAVERVEGTRLKATVFGYGHYVRSVVLPSLPPEIEVTSVHELDPQLIPDGVPRTDTCPHFRDDEMPDVTFVAGFHHSHALLAAEALRRGSAVVSEKPLATSQEQLDELMHEWSESARYFAGFQRRHMPANTWIKQDLPDEPMSYHTIVHEVGLPARHWYHWPNSGSRMVSNGCHWIDHFLFLNDFSPVEDGRAWLCSQGEIRCELRLANGANFAMTLTERGSDRLGVREHTQILTRNTTITITDASHYRCEDSRQVVRNETWHRLAPHRAMYADFARRLLDDVAGDDPASTRCSAQTVIDLEQQLR